MTPWFNASIVHVSCLEAGGFCGRSFLPAMSTNNMPLEYMTTTKVGEKGQLTVPKQFREDLGLGIGAPFAVLRLGDGLILLPEQRRFERLCERVRSSLTAAGLTSKDILATLPEARTRVYTRRYGKKPTDDVSRRRRSSPTHSQRTRMSGAPRGK